MPASRARDKRVETVQRPVTLDGSRRGLDGAVHVEDRGAHGLEHCSASVNALRVRPVSCTGLAARELVRMAALSMQLAPSVLAV